MALSEKEPKRDLKEIAFKAGEVVTIGVALIGATVSGINAAEGDLDQAREYGSPAVVWTIISGIIYAAERYYKTNPGPKPPKIH